MLLRRRLQAPVGPRRRVRKLRLLALLSVLGLVCTVSFTFGLVTAIASDIPKLDPSAEHPVEQNGYIYASDGHTVLAVLRGDQSRVVVDSDRIAPVMKQAIVAVEDRRFWEHRGVDIRGIVRAIVADLRNKEVVQGGSTITQQFVKKTLVGGDRTVSRKLKEAALAWQLERRWSKDRILTAYLNTIYFGNGAYGIEMAARVYFHTHADRLTLPQAALLAGMLANPSAFDPVTSPAAALQRRRTVLRLMLAQNLIAPADYAAADRTPLPDPESVHLPGTRGPSQYFVEYVKQQLVDYYGPQTVFGGGLRVTTSIDLHLQQLARRAIEQTLTAKGGPAAALVAIDPRDGRLLAMIGGSSYSKSQFNLAVQGERQAGSSFKPIVLATALAEGISPRTTYVSEPTTINLGDRTWSVTNYEGAYLGPLDLREATVHSDNSVYAQLTAQVGPANILQMAHRLGIRSPLDAYFSIGLGAEAVNPLEMARAYATFAHGGERVDGSLLGDRPRAVLRVVDGKRVDTNAPVDRKVLDEPSASLLTSILQDVVSHGTGTRAQIPGRSVAGKTGTTDNYGDAWFVGYTPKLAVAVWVGYPTRLKPMLTGFQGEPVSGGTYPALIWKRFVQAALHDEPAESFPPATQPYAAPVQVVYRNDHWLRANGYCRHTTTVYYFSGFGPKSEADCKPNEVDVPDVVGLTLDGARARLAAMPLTAKVVTRAAKGGEEPGVVVAQSPAKGTLSSWDPVRVTVAEARDGTVPDVVGMRVRKARELLEIDDLGGLVESVADGKAGVVVGQSPAPGRAAVPGMTIKLVVGRG